MCAIITYYFVSDYRVSEKFCFMENTFSHSSYVFHFAFLLQIDKEKWEKLFAK